MRRRSLLASIGMVALSGCGASERLAQLEPRKRGSGQPTSTPVESPQPTETPAESPGPTTPESTAVLVEEVPAELVQYEQFGETELAARGVLRNTSDRTLPYVEVNVDFLDASNTIVGHGLSNIVPLLAGRGWKYSVDYYSEANVPLTDVVATDVTTDYSEYPIDIDPDELDVVESELVDVEQFGEQTKAVRGTTENVGGTTLDFVEVTVHFLAENDVVVGSNFSNMDSLGPGQRWRFQVDYYSASDTPVAEVVNYDLIATT